MHTRLFATTGVEVSEIGLGCWQLGNADWGPLDEAAAQTTLQAAVEAGVTLLDTADIYGGGESERRIGHFLKGYSGPALRVATKFGRAGDPGGAANLTYASMRQHTLGSIQRLGVDRLWLTQGHCLPSAALAEGTVFRHLRQLRAEGLIENFGMSVETLEQAELCLQVEGLSSLQVIFNVLRQHLAYTLFEQARARGVAVIVRLPLASGLLSGSMQNTRAFAASDHRNYNRDGQAFNVGETFSGLPFATGIELVEQLKQHVPHDYSMIEFALRYCLDFPAVTSVIPGARTPAQARANARASELPALPAETHSALRSFYAEHVAQHIRGQL